MQLDSEQTAAPATETPSVAEPPKPAPPAAPPAPSDTPAGDGSDRVIMPDATPDELRKEIAKVRAEAAQARINRREAEKATADASTEERIAALETSLAAERLAASRLRVRTDLGLTEMQAELLVGTTEAELAAHAEKLITVFGIKSEAATPPAAGGSRPVLHGGVLPPSAPAETPAQIVDKIQGVRPV